MAKQSSIFKLHGTIDGVTFYKTGQDGFLAKAKGGVSKQKIMTDPKFLLTRQNGQEFGSAGKAGKTLRNTLSTILNVSKDNRMTSRLTKALVAIGKTDSVNTRGSRNVTKGALTLLKDFEFNVNAKLKDTFTAPYTSTIDRAAGTVKLDIASFTPLTRIKAPQGATHYQFVSSGCEVDFLKDLGNADNKASGFMPLDNNATAVISLNHALTAGSTLPLFHVVGIQFYQSVNGSFYPMRNGLYNAMCLVNIDNG